jgi:hypothetical protein
MNERRTPELVRLVASSDVAAGRVAAELLESADAAIEHGDNELAQVLTQVAATLREEGRG